MGAKESGVHWLCLLPSDHNHNHDHDHNHNHNSSPQSIGSQCSSLPIYSSRNDNVVEKKNSRIVPICQMVHLMAMFCCKQNCMTHCAPPKLLILCHVYTISLIKGLMWQVLQAIRMVSFLSNLQDIPQISPLLSFPLCSFSSLSTHSFHASNTIFLYATT